MNAPATELPECAIADLEPVVTDLRGISVLLSAMIEASSRDHGFGERELDAWGKLEKDLSTLTNQAYRNVSTTLIHPGSAFRLGSSALTLVD
jgi:hypothetical protein